MGQESLLKPIVILGRVGAPFGVRGLAHIQSFTNPPSNILKYTQWYLESKSVWKPIRVLDLKAQGSGFIAGFEGIFDRESVAELANCHLGVFRELLPDLDTDQYYWSDLIGLTVMTDTGTQLGVVKALMETGSNDVLVIQGVEKEHLVPYQLGDYVLEVDLTGRKIIVCWDPEF